MTQNRRTTLTATARERCRPTRGAAGFCEPWRAFFAVDMAANLPIMMQSGPHRNPSDKQSQSSGIRPLPAPSRDGVHVGMANALRIERTPSHENESERNEVNRIAAGGLCH